MQFGKWTATTRNGYIPGIPASADGLKPVTTRPSGIGRVSYCNTPMAPRQLLLSVIRDDP